MIGIALLALALAPKLEASRCQALDSDRIRMRDLAQADLRFAGADPDIPVGFSPEPGAKRIFRAAELTRLAERYGLDQTNAFHEFCFDRRARKLSTEEIKQAILAWAPPDAQVDVIEQSLLPAPVGQLVLPRPQAVRAAPDGSVLLRGFVQYGPARRFSVWARVRLHVRLSVVVAAEDIPAGTELRREQLRTEEHEGGIEAAEATPTIDQLSGRVSRLRIAKDSLVASASLEELKPVMRGALVRVEVLDGAARLELDGLAEKSGRSGEIISVRNPSSGKAFLARVTGPNAVLVIPRGVHLEGMKN